MDLNPATISELMKWLTSLIRETLTGGFCVLFIWLFLKEKASHMKTLDKAHGDQETLFNKILLIQAETNKALDRAVDALEGK